MEPAGSADSRCTQPESIQEQLIQDYGLLLGLDRYRYRVSGIGRYSPVYRWVSVSADTYLSIGADTSSPVGRLPVSTVNTVAMHTYSFKPILHFRAYTPHTYISPAHTYTLHKIAFSVQKKCTVRIGISIGIAVADSIGYRVPARYRSNPSFFMD